MNDVTESPRDALAADYARAGFGQRLAWGTRPALVLVDLIRAYFQPGAEFYLGSDACLAAAARVLAAARRAGIPVLYTRVEYDRDAVTGGLFVRKIPALRQLVAGNPLGEIMPAIAPDTGEIVLVKQYASAFFGTTLTATLNALGVDTLIVAGVSTSGCVRATAVDALQSGFVPLVVRQAVGDRDPGPHEASLFDLQAKYAEVVDEDAVVSWLAGSGSRPRLPLDEGPDFRARVLAGVDGGEAAGRLLQVGHGGAVLAGRVQQVGQVGVQGRDLRLEPRTRSV